MKHAESFWQWSSVELVAALLAGCVSTSLRVAQLTPIDLGPDGSAPITFTRLIVRVPSGTDVGAHHGGLLKVPRFRYTWLSNITVASDEFRIVASEHLKSRGYTVMGGDNLLFGRDESAKAQYQLGGTVQSLHYNTYTPHAGNCSKSSLTVEWQLFDVLKEEVVYEKSTAGYGDQQGIGSWCIQAAFRSALDNLLADAEFVAVVKKRPQDAWETEPRSLDSIDIVRPASQDSLSLPKGMDVVMECVLLIRAGGSTGSGVVISQDGHALTAAHLVSGLEEVVVRLRSGLELTAVVSRVDLGQDVALLTLPGRGHSCLSVATESVPGVGSDVFAVGAPTGEELAFTVTKGIISGFREWQGRHYLQTDAALNPGNSGGPLLSTDGKVVAIVSWKIAAPGFEGLSFGVPISAIVDRLAISWQ